MHLFIKTWSYQFKIATSGPDPVFAYCKQSKFPGLWRRPGHEADTIFTPLQNDITACANHTHPCGYVVDFPQYILDSVGSVCGAGLLRVKAFHEQVLKYLSALVEELSSLVSNCEREQNHLGGDRVEQERQQVETWWDTVEENGKMVTDSLDKQPTSCHLATHTNVAHVLLFQWWCLGKGFFMQSMQLTTHQVLNSLQHLMWYWGQPGLVVLACQF